MKTVQQLLDAKGGRIFSIAPDSPVYDALVIMADKHIGALVVLAIFAALGLDPVLNMFTWISQVGTLGVLGMMAVTSLAVIVFFLFFLTARLAGRTKTVQERLMKSKDKRVKLTTETLSSMKIIKL